jgi:hypothetical protein
MSPVLQVGAVQMFWHGRPLSRLERLAMSSFVANGHEVRLYAYEEPAGVPAGVTLADATQVLPREHLFEHARSGSIAPFADWFRYRLLYEHGGLWVDTDVVCLRAFDHTGTEIFARQDEHVINNAVLGLSRGHPLADWMAQSCERPNRWLPYDSLRTRRRKLVRRLLPGNPRERTKWGESGPTGLTLAADYLGYAAQALPPWHFYPVGYRDWRSIFEPGSRELEASIANSYALHLWNEMSRRESGFDKDARFSPDSLFERLCARYLPQD